MQQYLYDEELDPTGDAWYERVVGVPMRQLQFFRSRYQCQSAHYLRRPLHRERVVSILTGVNPDDVVTTLKGCKALFIIVFPHQARSSPVATSVLPTSAVLTWLRSILTWVDGDVGWNRRCHQDGSSMSHTASDS